MADDPRPWRCSRHWCGAAIVLVADLIYASSRWSGAFPRSFLVTLGGIAVCIAAAFALRLNRPVGADRKRARWNQRGVNVALVIVIVGSSRSAIASVAMAPGWFLERWPELPASSSA